MPDVYSSIIQNFAMPLLEGSDSKEVLQEKFSFAEMVWNYCIADEYKLTMLCLSIEHAIITETQKNKPFHSFLVFLKASKNTHFSQYKNYLVKTEVRQKSDGSLSVVSNFIEPKVLIGSTKKLCKELLKKGME